MRKKSFTGILLTIFLLIVVAGCGINTPKPSEVQSHDNLIYRDKLDTVVKVGCFNIPPLMTGTSDTDRKDGYCYEYIQELSRTLGWQYEYVYGDWPELVQKLENGEIDVLADMSFSQERAGKFLYPDKSMGYEAYYIYVPVFSSVDEDSIQQLNGKRIGVEVNSMQERYLRKWLASKGITAEVVPMSNPDTRYKSMMTGELDAVAETDTSYSHRPVRAVATVGNSEFYLAVAKNRSDILNKINKAQETLQQTKPNFVPDLINKWFSSEVMQTELSPQERQWLSNHQEIRVGYLENYMPYSGTEKSTGQAAGAAVILVDDLRHHIDVGDVKPVFKGYSSYLEMHKAFVNQEIDVMTPVYRDFWSSEMEGILESDDIASISVNMVCRRDQDLSKSIGTVAVSTESPINAYYAEVYFPQVKRIYYDTVKDCVDAVAIGQAEATFINTYNTRRFLDKEVYADRLISIEQPDVAHLCYGVHKSDVELLSIINKGLKVIPDGEKDKNLAQYASKAEELTGWDYIQKYWLPILLAGIIFVIVLGSLVVVTKNARKLAEANRRIESDKMKLEEANQQIFAANEELQAQFEQQQAMNEELVALNTQLEENQKLLVSQETLEEANRALALALEEAKYANIDGLTGLYNRHAFEGVIASLQNKDLADDFVVLIADVNGLKYVNDNMGHEHGDELIKAVSELLKTSFKKYGKVYRVGGDEFVILLHADRQNLKYIIEHFEDNISQWAEKSDNLLSLAYGWAAVYDYHGLTVEELGKIADEKMYKAKEKYYKDKGVDRRNNELRMEERIKQLEKANAGLNKLIKTGRWSVSFDENGKDVLANYGKDFMALLGYSEEDDFPDSVDTFHQLLHPDDIEAVLNSIKDHGQNEGVSAYHLRFRLRHKDGTYRWLSAAGEAVHREDGSVSEMYGIIVDITHHVQLEELEASREKALKDAEKANEALKKSLENQQALNEELQASYESQQALNEELMASNESQQALNEELMALNESIEYERAKIQQHLQVIEGLGDEYFSIILVDFEKDSVTAYRAEGDDGQDISRFLSEGLNKWSEFAPAYVEGTVLLVDRGAFYEALDKVAKEMPERFSHVYRKMGSDGNVMYLQATLVMVKDEDGKPMAVIGTRSIDNVLAEVKM